MALTSDVATGAPQARRARTRTLRGRAAAGGAPRVGAAPAIGVVHLTAEYWPLARTGGLGEAVHGLATFQAAAGQPVSVVLPLYRMVRERAPELERLGSSFAVPVGSRTEEAWLYRVSGGGAGTPSVFLIEHPEFFDRPGIYGGNGSDYPDNARRFAFFSLAALAALPRIAPEARVLHAHDWHTALGLLYLRTRFAGQATHDHLGTVLTVHNAGFQGHFAPAMTADLGIPPGLFTPDVLEWYGRVNWLKGGLAYADVATTVSPTHAAELRTPEGGFGLHHTFAALGDRLVGILNGINTSDWNPALDPHVAAHYRRDALGGKRSCKAAVQEAYGLVDDPRAPLFAMSARLVAQKGLDLVLGADLLSIPEAQFVFLGSGEHRYHAALSDFAARAPGRVAVEFAFTDQLEHRLLAGADFLLMPSLYEPCGLTQMRALRYGTIPVARRVGGLSDSIEDPETGFLFDAYTPAALLQAIGRAIEGYRHRAAWRGMMRRAMARSFDWDGSAAQYDDVYRRVLAARTAAR